MVGKCPVPGQRKICKCPTPGTGKASKWPAVARGGGEEVGAAGIDWYINLKCFIHVKITNLSWINK